MNEVHLSRVKNGNKKTDHEYKDIRTNVFKKIESITNDLTPYFSTVKQKIIQMAVDNIHQAVDYYFNKDTNRISRRYAEIFLESSKELINIARFLPSSDETTKLIKKITKELNEIREIFVKQYQYLKSLENEMQIQKKSDLSGQNIW